VEKQGCKWEVLAQGAMLSAAILQEKDTKLLTKVDFPQEETPWWVSLLPDPKPE